MPLAARNPDISPTTPVHQGPEPSESLPTRRLRLVGSFVAVVAAVTALTLAAPFPAGAAPATPAVTKVVTATTTSTAAASPSTAAKVGPRFWANMTTSKYETRLKLWMNRVRDNHKTRDLSAGSCEDRFAERWARHLTRSDRFYHQDLGPLMRTCRHSYTGEVLAKGSITPYQMVQMWMGSPGHRRLMLSRDFRFAGISAVRGRNNVWVGCVDFGRR